MYSISIQNYNYNSVLLAKAKQYLRIEDSNSDSLINMALKFVESFAEQYTGFSISSKRYTIKTDEIAGNAIFCKINPLLSIENVMLNDAALGNDKYYVDGQYIKLKSGGGSYVATVNCGYSSDDQVPSMLVSGLLLHTSYYYDGKIDTADDLAPLAVRQIYDAFNVSNGRAMNVIIAA